MVHCPSSSPRCSSTCPSSKRSKKDARKTAEPCLATGVFGGERVSWVLSGARASESISKPSTFNLWAPKWSALFSSKRYTWTYMGQNCCFQNQNQKKSSLHKPSSPCIDFLPSASPFAMALECKESRLKHSLLDVFQPPMIPRSPWVVIADSTQIKHTCYMHVMFQSKSSWRVGSGGTAVTSVKIGALRLGEFQAL